jgi:transposase-like protein
MSRSNSSEVPNQTPEKQRRYLSAEKKFQIYLEAQAGGKPVGELLRREGLFSTDLARIRQQVKEGALQRLGAKPGRQQSQVSPESLRGHQTRTPKQGTGTGRPVGRTGDPAKKNEWGFVGPISGLWLKEQTKLAILTVIETSRQQGVSARRTCSLLAIEHRRDAGNNRPEACATNNRVLLRLRLDGVTAGVIQGGTGVAPVKFGVPPNFAGRRGLQVGGRWKNNRRRKRFPARRRKQQAGGLCHQ